MSKVMAQISTAQNLARLAKEFKSGDPAMSAGLRREFKDLSKNDVVRTVLYLMEVIGSRDQQFKRIEEDNKDLKEILKLNDIKLDDELEKLNEKSDVSVASPIDSGSTQPDSTTQNVGPESASDANVPA